MQEASNVGGFTSKQLQDWRRYEEVRSEGRFNMFDSRARELTGLDQDEYTFVMKNFSELEKAAIAEEDAFILKQAEFYGH